jgi:hypothetical protein
MGRCRSAIGCRCFWQIAHVSIAPRRPAATTSKSIGAKDEVTGTVKSLVLLACHDRHGATSTSVLTSCFGLGYMTN